MADNEQPPEPSGASAPQSEPPAGTWHPGQGKGPAEPAPAAPAVRASRRPSSRTVWALVALACVIAGLVASVLVARSTARSDASATRRSFAHRPRPWPPH